MTVCLYARKIIKKINLSVSNWRQYLLFNFYQSGKLHVTSLPKEVNTLICYSHICWQVAFLQGKEREEVVPCSVAGRVSLCELDWSTAAPLLVRLERCSNCSFKDSQGSAVCTGWWTQESRTNCMKLVYQASVPQIRPNLPQPFLGQQSHWGY